MVSSTFSAGHELDQKSNANWLKESIGDTFLTVTSPQDISPRSAADFGAFANETSKYPASAAPFTVP